MVHRLEEVTLSKFRRFAGQSGAELEGQDGQSRACPSFMACKVPGNKAAQTGQETLERKTLQVPEFAHSNDRRGQEEKEKQSHSLWSGDKPRRDLAPLERGEQLLIAPGLRHWTPWPRFPGVSKGTGNLHLRCNALLFNC